MNIYDFDETIYDGDSGVDLFFYSFKKYPFLMIKQTIKLIVPGLKFVFKKITLTEVKELIFTYLKHIPDLDKYIDKFVELHLKNIKKWYKETQKEDDVVISASFYLWIKPFCERLGIKHVIATIYDVEKSEIIGENCHGEEKIRRFKELYPEATINNTYSDSPNDIPLLKFGKKGYVVKGNELFEYKNDFKF